MRILRKLYREYLIWRFRLNKAVNFESPIDNIAFCYYTEDENGYSYRIGFDIRGVDRFGYMKVSIPFYFIESSRSYQGAKKLKDYYWKMWRKGYKYNNGTIEL